MPTPRPLLLQATVLTVLALASTPPAAAQVEPHEPAPALLLGGVQGDVTWFRGDHEALLGRAAEERRPVFLYFYAGWSSWCRDLEAEVFTDDGVVEALAGTLCAAIDVESDVGGQLAARYRVDERVPAFLFLDADGALNDSVRPSKSPTRFTAEVQRILRDEDTLGDLRRRVAGAPEDLELVWALGRKLERLGDRAGYDEQIARLRELDPEGISRPLRSLALEALERSLWHSGECQDLLDFLAEERHPGVLFSGWSTIAAYEAKRARKAKAPEEVTLHRRAMHAANRAAWPHCPASERGWFGNNLAWELYEDWPALGADDRDFAVTVARAAVAAEPDRATVLDTLACCLFADGQTTEASALIERCIELEPSEPRWRQRLEMMRSRDA